MYKHLPPTSKTVFPLVLTGVSSLVTAFSLLIPSGWVVALFGTALFLYTLWRFVPSLKEGALLGFLFGVVVSGASLFWFWDTLPLSWTGFENGTAPYVLVAVAWLYGSVALAIPFSLFAPLFVFIRTYWYAPLLVGVLWFFLEEARMWSFSFLMWGKESTLEPYFSVGNFGYVLAQNPYLLQIASLGGVGALALFLGVIVGSIASLAFARQQIGAAKAYTTSAFCFLLGISFLAVYLYVSYRPPQSENPLSIALVSLAVKAEDTPEYRDVVGPLQTLGTLTNPPDLIVFPEGYGISSGDENTNYEQFFSSLFGTNEVLVINSSYKKLDALSGFGRIEYLSSTNGFVGTHEKTILVPLGEYLPSILLMLLQTIDNEGMGTYLERRFERQTLKGDNLSTVSFKGTYIGALLCSEILSPTRYHSLSEDRQADVFINVANNAWFHESRLLHRQLIEIAKTHAVYSRKYFLTANNDAPSYAIDPRGSVIGETLWDKPGVFIVEVPIN